MNEPESPEEIDELFIDDEDESEENAVEEREGEVDDADDVDELHALFIDDAEDAEDDGADGEVAPVDAAADELSARVEELERELAEAREAVAANHERLVRKAADLENARRRHQREKDDLTKYASESVLKDMVPVLDDLRRALEHWGNGDQSDGATLVEGLEMVARKFEQMLARRGVTAVDAKGQPFDPQYHEAIQQVDDDSVPHNTVVQEFQRGYVIHNRLLRPALVVVAQGGPIAEASGDESEAEDAPGEVNDGPASSVSHAEPVDSEATDAAESNEVASDDDQTEVADEANVDEDSARAEESADDETDAESEDGANLEDEDA